MLHVDGLCSSKGGGGKHIPRSASAAVERIDDAIALNEKVVHLNVKGKESRKRGDVGQGS